MSKTKKKPNRRKPRVWHKWAVLTKAYPNAEFIYPVEEQARAMLGTHPGEIIPVDLIERFGRKGCTK